MDEPTRQVDPGENPMIMNPGNISAVDIAILAMEWRWKVEEYERETLIDKDREERALETRRKMRSLRWDADWADYRSTYQGGVLQKISDHTGETRGDEMLLGHTFLELGQRCWVCRGEGLDKSFVCAHVPESIKIHGHGKCFVQALIRMRACLQCRRPVKFVLKSSFDDPKSWWDEGRKSGFKLMVMLISRLVLMVGISLSLYGEEDRWGDQTQERADIYHLAQLLCSHRGRYVIRTAVSGG